MYGYTRRGVGQFDPGAFLSTSVITPAEKTAQYTMLGAVGAGAVALILLLAGEIVASKKRLPVAGLIALPVVGTLVGLALVKKEYS